MNQNDCMATSIIPRRYLVAGLVVSLAVIAIFTVCKPMQHDETEFYQTAWLMSQGKCIYRDFFQHHNPLAYWLYEPLLKAVPPQVTLKTLIILRLPGLAIFLTAMVCLYCLFRKIFTPTVATIGVFLLATWPLYLSAFIFTRPDNLMNLCLILGLCAIFKKNSAGVGVARWLVCGLLCGLAFCFLQKAIPFACVFLLILTARVFRKAESWKTLAAFMFGGLLIGGIFLGVMDRFFGWELYWACCWKFNMTMPTESPIGLKRAIEWAHMMMYAFIPAWGLLGILWAFRHRVAREFAFFALAGGYGSFALAPFGHQQYAIFMMISAAPFAAWAFCVLYEKYGRKFLWAIVIFMLLTTPQYIVRIALLWTQNCQQMAVHAELDRIPMEKRYVFSRHFYLFCPQPDYMWFNWEYSVPAWRTAAPSGNKFEVHDYLGLVKQYCPLLIDVNIIPQVSHEELEQAGYHRLSGRFRSLDENIWYKSGLFPQDGK